MTRPPAERDRRGAPQACHPATAAVGENDAAVRRPIFFSEKRKAESKCKMLG
ncbi:MAG: hypothetical protein IKP58_12485 [Victivallales bacterium]|nr:hypothetical protein [Victivallales bacterium]